MFTIIHIYILEDSNDSAVKKVLDEKMNVFVKFREQ